MKNFSKNNYSKKNSDNDKRRSQSKNFYKSNKFKDDRFKSNKFKNDINKSNKINSCERDNLSKIRDDFNSKEFSYPISKDKAKSNFKHTNRMIYSNRLNKENFSENIPKHNQNNSNERNFEDWIWGKHSVLEALNSDRPINRIWCTSDIFSSEKFFLLLKDFKSRGVLIEELSWNRLSQLTYGAVHQGIALQLASSNTISLKTLIDKSKVNTTNPIIVALDGITDPHNLGAIIRSAEAFHCQGIIIPQRRSSGLTGTVAKVAAGALEHIPVSRVVNLNRAIEELKKNNFLIIGLSREGRVPISKFKEKAPLVVIVGAENKGISMLTQKNCDYLLKIPLKGKTSSLNASVAAAISICYLSSNF